MSIRLWPKPIQTPATDEWAHHICYLYGKIYLFQSKLLIIIFLLCLRVFLFVFFFFFFSLFEENVKGEERKCRIKVVQKREARTSWQKKRKNCAKTTAGHSNSKTHQRRRRWLLQQIQPRRNLTNLL